MPRQTSKLDVQLKVEYVPLSEERREAWCASLLLLVNWIVEDLIANPEISDEPVDIDPVRDARGIWTSLFSLEDPTARKETSKTSSIYAWVIGHDGSAHRMALADWRV